MYIVNVFMNMLATVHDRLFPRFNPFNWFSDRTARSLPTIPLEYAMAGEKNFFLKLKI